MNTTVIDALAARLLAAAKNRTPVPPFTAEFPEMTTADAYAVQMAVVASHLLCKEAIIGKKVGLTSLAIREMLGVSEPDFGHLLTDMLYAEETLIPMSVFLQPRIEAELAFVMGEDVAGPGVSTGDILRATKAIVPSFEIIDSRITDWKIEIQDTIADNGSCGGLVIGATQMPVDAVNLQEVGLVLVKNGSIIDTAVGAAVMGHPAAAVAWLANTLGKMGIPLKKGEIVLSGSFTRAYPIETKDTFTASFAGLGSVTATFY